MELSNYLTPGEKIEIQEMGRDISVEVMEFKKVYVSRISELLAEDKLEITMPLDKTKLVLLDVDKVYDFYFYTSKGMYQANAKITERYKKENIFLMIIELTSKLRKFQRREYYRYGCTLEMQLRKLELEEEEAYKKRERYFLPEFPAGKATIVDISGGGIRFVTSEPYEVNGYIYCGFQIMMNQTIKKYELVGRVLASKKIDNQENIHQYRAQFCSITKQEQEELIRFIFEEERKNRRKEKW